MRIGLYGLPTAGKTHILNRLDFIEVLSGGKILRDYDPEFDGRSEEGRERARREVARKLLARETFIMDGHYAFGDEIAFTAEEGEMYEVYLYLYVDPSLIRSRMESSEKNRKYMRFDIERWQKTEIEGLREYCHVHDKDFYVIDNPPRNGSSDTDTVIDFIRDIVGGYSCAQYARQCVEKILDGLGSDTVVLADGDGTLTLEDSSAKTLGYSTNLFDGNYYTGYQYWRQAADFAAIGADIPQVIPVRYNPRVLEVLRRGGFVLTSGHIGIWDRISKTMGVSCFSGRQMAAETKLYITKGLQREGKKVVAYGDGMNDFFMLKQADEAYLVTKEGGRVSRSLEGRDLGGIGLV